MTDKATFLVRFRFRVAKPFSLNTTHHLFRVGDQDALLLPQDSSVPIQDSNWVVMRIEGFANEAEARRFGHKLKLATSISSLCCRLGIDPGDDRPTSSPSQYFIDKTRNEQGIELRVNIHGIDVYEDIEATQILSISGMAIIRTQPQPFLSNIEEVLKVMPDTLPRSLNAAPLMNAALINPEPLAQLALAISAVEMLGQDLEWDPAQKSLLEALAKSAERAEAGTSNDRKEVADAIRRGTHRVGLRQGVLRALNQIGLSDLKREWDEVYKQRSAIFHGLKPISVSEQSVLAQRAITLCGRIVLVAIAKDIPNFDARVDQYYPVPSGTY